VSDDGGGQQDPVHDGSGTGGPTGRKSPTPVTSSRSLNLGVVATASLIIGVIIGALVMNGQSTQRELAYQQENKELLGDIAKGLLGRGKEPTIKKNLLIMHDVGLVDLRPAAVQWLRMGDPSEQVDVLQADWLDANENWQVVITARTPDDADFKEWVRLHSERVNEKKKRYPPL